MGPPKLNQVIIHFPFQLLSNKLKLFHWSVRKAQVGRHQGKHRRFSLHSFVPTACLPASNSCHAGYNFPSCFYRTKPFRFDGS